MMQVLFCLAQVTLVSSIALLLMEPLLKRAPGFAANVALCGALLSVLTVLACYVELPRLWSIPSVPKSELAHLQPQPITDAPIQSTPVEDSLSLTPWDSLWSVLPEGRTTVVPSIDLAEIWLPMMALLSACVVLRACLGSIGLALLVRSSTRCQDDRLNRELASLTTRVRLAGIKIRSHTKITNPCVCWIAPKTILVPAGFENWHKSERKACIAHELAHIARRDAIWRLVAQLCMSPICIHPCVYLLNRKLKFAQELATDRVASELLNSTSYRQGLSLLALRMDSQAECFAPFQVSVSNNLVRRIKMLHLPKRSLLPWQMVTLLMTFVGLTSFVLSWNIAADEPRSQPSDASNAFQREHFQPWKELGPKPGYWCVSGHQLALNRFWAKLWDEYSMEMGIAGFDHTEFGLTIENTKTICTDFIVSMHYLPPEKRDEDNPGKEWQGKIESSTVAISTFESVNWLDLGSALLETTEFPPVVEEGLRAVFQEHGTNRKFLMKSNRFEGQEVPRQAELKATAELVNGGVFLCSTLCPTAQIREILPKAGPIDDPLGVLEFVKDIQVLSIGIDVGEDPVTQFGRVALLPSEDAEVQQLAIDLAKRLGKAAEMLKGLPPQAGVDWTAFGEAISAIDIDVVDSGFENRPALLLTTSTNLDFWKLLDTPARVADTQVDVGEVR